MYGGDLEQRLFTTEDVVVRYLVGMDDRCYGTSNDMTNEPLSDLG